MAPVNFFYACMNFIPVVKPPDGTINPALSGHYEIPIELNIELATDKALR